MHQLDDRQEIINNPPSLQTAQDVEEYIHILQDHQTNCEKAGKYMEADASRNRISDLKQQLSVKRKKEMQYSHNAQRSEVEKAHLDEFNQFNSFWDQKMIGFDEEAKKVEQELIQRQEQEYKQISDELDKTIPYKPKETSEILNLRKIEEHMARQKCYVEAHQIQQKRSGLEKEETNGYLNLRTSKIKNQLNQLAQRHQNELNALQQRISAGQDELRKNRSVDLERLLQKYQNVKNELDGQQQMESLAFDGQFKSKGGGNNNSTFKSSKMK